MQVSNSVLFEQRGYFPEAGVIRIRGTQGEGHVALQFIIVIMHPSTDTFCRLDRMCCRLLKVSACCVLLLPFGRVQKNG
jgi:hypothetical protein